jgi:tRNA pseudouridine55 synthase
MPRPDKLNGILLIDKELGDTSHDVVAKVRKLVNQRKVGHTGTLDPLASGLLLLCLGKGTKVSQFLSDSEKSYAATIRLGLRSSTYDAEGVDQSTQCAEIPASLDASFLELLRTFEGWQDQQVPPHASVRLNGRHMYDMTRNGETFDLPYRTIEIKSLKVLSYEAPDLSIEVTCSKGTYIRSLAHDIGEKLGCGAYLASLRRTSVGRFNVAEADTLEQLRLLVESEELQTRLVPIEKALEFSSILLQDQGRDTVSHGRAPRWQDVIRIEGSFRLGDKVLLTDAVGAALAVAIAGSDSKAEHVPTAHTIESFVRVLA